MMNRHLIDVILRMIEYLEVDPLMSCGEVDLEEFLPQYLKNYNDTKILCEIYNRFNEDAPILNLLSFRRIVEHLSFELELKEKREAKETR